MALQKFFQDFGGSLQQGIGQQSGAGRAILAQKEGRNGGGGGSQGDRIKELEGMIADLQAQLQGQGTSLGGLGPQFAGGELGQNIGVPFQPVPFGQGPGAGLGGQTFGGQRVASTTPSSLTITPIGPRRF